MSCPVCGARTSGLCKRCEREQRLERERQERLLGEEQEVDADDA